MSTFGRVYMFCLLSLTASSVAHAQQAAPAKEEAAKDDGDSSRDDGVIDRSRALGDRIKSVQRRAFIKRNRHELSVMGGLSINDAFFQSFAIGGAYTYHIFDTLALELNVKYFPPGIKTDAVRVVRQTQVAVPSPDITTAQLAATLDVQFAPIYGKMSLMSEKIIHYDVYIAGGFGIMNTDADRDNIRPAGSIAIGTRVFALDWLTIRLEVRDYLYSDRRTQLNESAVQNYVLFNIGASFFFPFTFDYRYE